MTGINSSSNYLNVSQNVQNVLKEKGTQDIINNILADGVVDGADNAKLKELNAKLKTAADVDTNDDDGKLVESLDSTGGFLGIGTTNTDIVQKNLLALKKQYDMNPSQLSFEGVQITDEGIFSDTDYTLKIIGEKPHVDSNLEDALNQVKPTAPTATTPATTTPATTTPAATTPAVTTPAVTTPAATTPAATTPAATTPAVTTPAVTTPEKPTDVLTNPQAVQNLEQEAAKIRTSPKLKSSLEQVQAQLHNHKDQILETQTQKTMKYVQNYSMDTVLRQLGSIEGNTATKEDLAQQLNLPIDDPSLDNKIKELLAQKQALGQINDLESNIQDFLADPSKENLSSLDFDPVLNGPALMNNSSELSQNIVSLRATLDTANELGTTASSVDSRIKNQRFQSPGSSETLLAKLEDQSLNLYVNNEIDGTGLVNNAIADVQSLRTELDGLKNTDPETYQKLTAGLGDNYFKELDVKVNTLSTMAGNYEKASPETLNKLNDLKEHLKLLRFNTKGIKLSEDNPASTILTKAEDIAGYNSSLGKAISEVENTLEFQTATAAELEHSANQIDQLLKQEGLPEDVKKILTSQKEVLSKVHAAIQNGEIPQLSDSEKVDLDSVLSSLTQATDYQISNFDLGFGLGGFSGFGFLPWMSPISTPALQLPQDLSLTPTNNQFAAGTGNSLFSSSTIPNQNSNFFDISGGLTLQNPVTPNILDVTSVLNAPLPMMSLTSPSPLSFGSGLFETTPPSLSETLLNSAQKTANINQIETLDVPQEQKTAIQKMMTDYNLDDKSKSYLMGAVQAKANLEQGKGDALVNGVPSSELAKDLDLLTQIYDQPDLASYTKKTLIESTITQLSSQTTPEARNNTRLNAQKALNSGEEQLAVTKRSLQADQAQTTASLMQAKTGKEKITTEIAALTNGDGEGKLTEADTRALLNDMGIENSGSINLDDPNAVTEAILAKINEKGTSQEKLDVLTLALAKNSGYKGAKLDKDQVQQLKTLFTNIVSANTTIQESSAKAIASIDVQIKDLTELQANAPAGQKDRYGAAITSLTQIRSGIESGNITQTNIDTFTSVTLLRNLEVQVGLAKQIDGMDITAGLASLKQGWTDFAHSIGRPEGFNATEVLQGVGNAIGTPRLQLALDKTKGDLEVVLHVATEQAENKVLNKGFAGTITALVTGGPLPQTVNQTGGSTPGFSGQNTTIPNSAGDTSPHETEAVALVDRLEGITAQGILSGEQMVVFSTPDAHELASLSESEQALYHDLQKESLGVGASIENVLAQGPEAIDQYLEDMAEANTKIGESMDAMKAAMEILSTQMAQSNDAIAQSNADAAAIVNQAAQARTDQNVQALVAKADALGNSLSLTPNTGPSGEDNLQKLVEDFINIIRDADYKTRQLVLAQLANQMMNNAITSFYKNKTDGESEYHEDMMNRLADGFKQQIERGIEMSLANQATNSQAAAAVSGQVGGEVIGSIINDTTIVNDFDQMLDQSGLNQSQQERIMTGITSILEAAGSGPLEDDQTSLMDLYRTLQEHKPSLN